MSVAPEPDVVEYPAKALDRGAFPDQEGRASKPVGQKFWYDLFEEYDTTHDGRIPLDRFHKLVREGADRLGLTAGDVAELLREADANDDHCIDFAEVVEMMTRLKGMYGRRLSLYTARAMLPKPQQTQPAREILEHEWWPPPVFILSFIAMEVFFFVYQLKACGPWTTGPPPCFFDRAFILSFAHPFQIWRWITNIFVHHDIRHLFGNVVGQILFGATLELAHRWRIVVVFLLGALSSALFAAAVRPMTVLRSFLAGASGGVYALIGAHIANVALNWDEMRHPYRHAILVAAFVGWDTFGAFREATGPLPSSTSYAGHAGGFIGGILLGFIFLRNLVEEKWESRLRKAVIVAYTVYTLCCIFLIVVRPLIYHDEMCGKYMQFMNGTESNGTTLPTPPEHILNYLSDLCDVE